MTDPGLQIYSHAPRSLRLQELAGKVQVGEGCEGQDGSGVSPSLAQGPGTWHRERWAWEPQNTHARPLAPHCTAIPCRVLAGQGTLV